MNSLALSELTYRIQEVIGLNFGKPVWIRAEISELRENSGHCYMELVEKSEDSDSVLAKCRATCWASTYRMLKPYFESTTGQALSAGMKVLVAVTVDFHGVYGLNLNVRDIDPVFTVGEMAARRLQILRQLEADGIADMNKQLAIPVPAQRIAIISSPTAAGYDDFQNQLLHNKYGFVFYTKLFPAVMQGEATEASVIGALEQIYAQIDLFDVVVIIRGGGATADLAAFDSYDLALNCTQFPIPVLTGIGHQRDVSILDMVAHTSLKTPTAVAEFLVANLQAAENRMLDVFSDIQYFVRRRLENEHRNMESINFRIKYAIRNNLTQKSFLLQSQKQRLQTSAQLQLMKQRNKIGLLSKNIESHSPAFLLEYGYSITTLNGKRVNSAKQIASGNVIKTYFPDGDVDSKVI
ncbi:exodeoxyribonuclease VII large subunit [Paludibacter sp. 221]|uniref:exodeoxyribonuclease VII large subunit n=1 Tax=Paludibacter sp. 221 TaxID=2302939 RepID=UPI0013D4F0AD|nr:exodeoxyribonuclease VII large subunit [Paludibacter sp. 221]NDV46538.1 exodeoxyribonuclease VII large subunit [Paludibacter sp. 221]